MKQKKKCPLVLVLWLDANTVGGWQPGSDIKPETTKSVSVGWMYEENEHHLVIFSSYNHEGDISDITTIPAPWICEKKQLRGNAAILTVEKSQ